MTPATAAQHSPPNITPNSIGNGTIIHSIGSINTPIIPPIMERKQANIHPMKENIMPNNQSINEKNQANTQITGPIHGIASEQHPQHLRKVEAQTGTAPIAQNIPPKIIPRVGNIQVNTMPKKHIIHRKMYPMGPGATRHMGIIAQTQGTNRAVMHILHIEHRRIAQAQHENTNVRHVQQRYIPIRQQIGPRIGSINIHMVAQRHSKGTTQNMRGKTEINSPTPSIKMKVGIPHRSNMHNVGIPQNIPKKKFTGRRKQSANRKYGQTQGMNGIIIHIIRPTKPIIIEISIIIAGPIIVPNPPIIEPMPAGTEPYTPPASSAVIAAAAG